MINSESIKSITFKFSFKQFEATKLKEIRIEEIIGDYSKECKKKIRVKKIVLVSVEENSRKRKRR